MAVSTPNQYPVRLTAEQRTSLLDITVRHAQVLLWSDLNCETGRQTRREISERLEMHVYTVDPIRKRFVLEGEAPALNCKVRQTPAVPPKIDGVIEAHLIAICTEPAPEGRAQRALSLLANELKR